MIRRQKQPETAAQLRQRMQNRTSLDEIFDAKLDSQFKTSVAAVSLARYLCEHIETLHLSAQTRILDTHDYLVMLVPLIDEPPWTRRRQIESSSKDEAARSPGMMIWEKLKENHTWEKVEPVDLLKITKCEAQCWIALFHLTCTPLCRERYGLNTFRKEQLLRLRKFLSDVMLDQLPVLADVRRYMDELTLLTVPENVSGHGSALLLQQVDSIREEILQNRNWDDVVRTQYENIFSKVKDATDTALRRISDVYNLDGIENVFAVVEGNLPRNVGKEEVVKKDQISAEEEEDILSKPLDGVSLRVQNADNEELIAKFECIAAAGDDGSTTQTPNGLFRRMKMEVRQTDMCGKNTEEIPSDSSLIASISFENGKHSVEVRCDDIDLPLASDGGGCPTKVWRQVGSLKEGIIVQIGFKFLSTARSKNDGAAYGVDQVFLSQPVPNE